MPIRQPHYTARFGKDLEKMRRSGKDLNKIKFVLGELIAGQPLEPRFSDHKLLGNYQGRREYHIEPDWLLVYKIDSDKIIFERTGSHNELFR